MGGTPPPPAVYGRPTTRDVLNGKKKKCSGFPKKPAGTPCAQPWLVAVGGWRLAAVGGWQLATGGWWRLVVVGGGWWLAVGGWRQLAVVGSWRLVAAGGWRLVAGGWWRLVVATTSLTGGPLLVPVPGHPDTGGGPRTCSLVLDLHGGVGGQGHVVQVQGLQEEQRVAVEVRVGAEGRQAEGVALRGPELLRHRQVRVGGQVAQAVAHAEADAAAAVGAAVLQDPQGIGGHLGPLLVAPQEHAGLRLLLQPRPLLHRGHEVRHGRHDDLRAGL